VKGQLSPDSGLRKRRANTNNEGRLLAGKRQSFSGLKDMCSTISDRQF